MALPSPSLQQFDLAPVAQRLLEQAYRLLAALPLLLLSAMVIGVAWWLGSWISRRAVLDRIASRNPFLRDLTRTTTRWMVVLVGVLIALEIMNATALVGAVLGTAGVLGVALGFAFKDILENYLAGILMSTRQPFQPRDHVVIDGNEGVIVSLTSRATILMTLDGNHVRLPNALVFRSVILNYTRNPNRRFTVDVGVGVNEDLVKTRTAGVDSLCKLPGVLQKPPPRALITALGDSNVQVQFHGWVDQRSNDFLRVRSEAIRAVKLALEAAGIDMPEPIYRVQVSPPNSKEEVLPVPIAPVTEATDTSSISDIGNQIEAERNQHADSNLLDPAAPRE